MAAAVTGYREQHGKGGKAEACKDQNPEQSCHSLSLERQFASGRSATVFFLFRIRSQPPATGRRRRVFVQRTNIGSTLHSGSDQRSYDERHQPFMPIGEKGDDPVADTLERKIDLLVANAQMPQRERVDADRQPRPGDMDFAVPAVDFQAEAGLHQHEGGTGRPRLRQAGDGIGDRRFARRAGKTAEQFGQPHVEMDGGFERAAHQPDHAVALAIARQAGAAHGGVMRPDRAVVV